jgi:hypothetical protein
MNLEDQGVMKYERSQSKPNYQMSEIGLGLGRMSSPVSKIGRAGNHPRPSVYDDRESNAGGSDAGLEEESLIYDSAFLKKYIPARESHPELHDHLLQLWGHRQTVLTAMHLALDDEDGHHYEIYRKLFAEADREMFVVLRQGLRTASPESNSPLIPDWLMAASSEIKSPFIPDVSLDLTALPKDKIISDHGEEIRGASEDRTISASHAQSPAFFSPESSHVQNTRWRDIDSMPFSDVLLPEHKLRQSYKETDHSYEVFLAHQGCLLCDV